MKNVILIIMCCVLCACNECCMNFSECERNSEARSFKSLVKQATEVKEIPKESSKVVYSFEDFIVLNNGYAVVCDKLRDCTSLTDDLVRVLKNSDFEEAYSEAKRNFSKNKIYFEDRTISSVLRVKNNIFIVAEYEEFVFDISKNVLFLEVKTNTSVYFILLGSDNVKFHNMEGVYAQGNIDGVRKTE